jgi:uncharacterized protein (TIGR02001 family)
VRLRAVGVNFRLNITRACGVAGLMAGMPLHADEFHGYLTIASDYVFRGASQSNEDWTLLAGLDYVRVSGLYGGIYAARTEFPQNSIGANPGSLELDAYLGYRREVGRRWSWDVAVIHYDYPNATGFDYSYDELAVNLHFRDFLRIGATAANDAGAGGESGYTAEVGVRRSFGDRYQASGALGYYEYGRYDWDDYSYWDVGISVVAGPITVDLRYFDTTADEAGFADPTLTGARLAGSVSIGF